MVKVMKPSTGITRYEMKRVEEWYVIATVHINRFHQPDCDPCPQQYEMSCGRDDAEKESKPKYCKYMQQCCYFNCVFVLLITLYETDFHVSSVASFPLSVHIAAVIARKLWTNFMKFCYNKQTD